MRQQCSRQNSKFVFVSVEISAFNWQNPSQKFWIQNGNKKFFPFSISIIQIVLKFSFLTFSQSMYPFIRKKTHICDHKNTHFKIKKIPRILKLTTCLCKNCLAKIINISCYQNSFTSFLPTWQLAFQLFHQNTQFTPH